MASHKKFARFQLSNTLRGVLIVVVVGSVIALGIKTQRGSVADNQALSAPDGYTTFSSATSLTNSPTISSGSLSKTTAISPYVYGTNQVWYDNGYGVANPSTEQPYSQLVSDTKSIGISIIRYPGGNPSDLFHWQQATGPMASRGDQLADNGGSFRASGFVPSTFGPDEFGTLLDQTGAAGDITVNFGTGTANEAEAWVCYMTAAVNTTNKTCAPWAALRAANGHSAPYNVPYWEVGNETNVGEYWRAGSVVSSPGNCKTGQDACLYVYGGTTKFVGQSLLYLHTQDGTSVSSTGAYYLADPPVVANSVSLSVQIPVVENQGASEKAVLSAASVWQQVSPAALATSTLGSHMYAVSASTGAISFHFQNGSTSLPAGSVVTGSYSSGPHQGFATFYAQMKAADPAAHICATYPGAAALQALGTTHPYDCYVVHDYAVLGGDDNGDLNASQFHDQIMLNSQTFNTDLAATQKAVTAAAGHAVPVVMTEYGILNYDSPTAADIEPTGSTFAGQSDYHRSLDVGLYVANMLMNIITNHLALADKHYLVSYNFTPTPGLQGGFDTHMFSGNAMIDTSYPDCTGSVCPAPAFVMQPSAYVFQEYSQLLYRQLITTSGIQGDPEIQVAANTAGDQSAASGSYPALSMIATTDGKGHEAMLVINNSATNQESALIEPSSSNYSYVSASTLAGNGANSYLDFNTLAQPDAVALKTSAADFVGGKVAATFPASSVTVLRFSSCTQAPGAPTDLTATPVSTTEIDLHWQAGSLGTGCQLAFYNVLKDSQLIAPATTTSYKVTGLTAGTSYSFNVEATDTAAHTSGASTTVTAQTLPAPAPTPAPTPTPTPVDKPTIPGNFTTTLTTTNTVGLSWSPSTDSGGTVSVYRIFRNAALIARVKPPTTYYLDTSLPAGTTYHYYMTAASSAGVSSIGTLLLSVTTRSLPAGVTGGCALGDLNQNPYNVVGVADLSILLSHYGQSATVCQGALTGSGTVTAADLSRLNSDFTGGGTSPETGGP